MTSVFGSEALGLSSLQLGMTILMVQFVAFPGAIMFGFIARKIGDRNAVLITLIVWIISVTCMYPTTSNNVERVLSVVLIFLNELKIFCSQVLGVHDHCIRGGSGVGWQPGA